MTSPFSRRLAKTLALTLALTLGAPFLGACVDGDYNQFRVFQKPIQSAVDSLRPGQTDLQSALNGLGAPVFVVEVGLGMALAWGWQETTDWNIEVSGPIGDAQGQIQFASSNEDTMGIVLFFDEEWRLTSFREGFLGDLVPKRQLPRDVEDELRAEP